MAKSVLAAFSLISLAVCLAAPALHFYGKLTADDYKLIFLIASIGWFVFATLWAKMKTKA